MHTNFLRIRKIQSEFNVIRLLDYSSLTPSLVIDVNAVEIGRKEVLQ